MPGELSVEISNVINGATIETPAVPPYFQVQVAWNNPKNKNGTVTLAATNGVTITPVAGYAAAANSNGVSSFSLSSTSSVTGVELTAGLDVPTRPPVSTSDYRMNITVTVT